MTMRDDVRTAFDREQSALGEMGDAPHRLMHGAMAGRDVPASRGLQWAAGIAAVLIAAIVITTFALVKAGSHTTAVPVAAPSPRAQASPTPLTNTLNVPDSTPVILYYDPADPHQVDGMTWDGKTRGKMASLTGITAVANPANNLFATATEIRDRQGKLTAAGTFGSKFFAGTWADDEIHICAMVPFDTASPDGAATTLRLLDSRVGGGRDIVKVGRVYQQAAIWVAACSVEFDRAVVVQSGGQGVGTNRYWVIQMSTGKILWTHTFDPNALPVQIISSRDGQFIAEEQATASGSVTVWNSTVVGPDGTVAAHLKGAVYGFCWDGSLAVVDPGGANGPTQIVRVSDDSIVWSGPDRAGFGVSNVFVQPDGAELAVAIHNPAYPSQPADAPIGQPQVDLYVVAPDGRVITTLRRVYV